MADRELFENSEFSLALVLNTPVFTESTDSHQAEIARILRHAAALVETNSIERTLYDRDGNAVGGMQIIEV